MKVINTLFLTASLGLAAAPGAWAAAITYNLVNYPLLQAGATLTGTITTDGSTGLGLSGGTIIQSWQITVTGGSHPFSVSSTDSGAWTQGTLDATLTTLSLTTLSGEYLNLGVNPGRIYYYPGDGMYYADSTGAYAWNNVNLLSSGLDGSGGWSVGSALSAVPEPSEWAAISFGVLGMVWVAKRRFMPARA